MGQVTIGLLSPGEMGAAVGGCLARRGLRVLWASAGRGPATAERARAAGLTDAGTIDSLARQAGVILSVCPPHAALALARSVTSAGWPAGTLEGSEVGRGAVRTGAGDAPRAGAGDAPRAGAGDAPRAGAGGSAGSGATDGTARGSAGPGAVYVDANAISPATAREVARVVGEAGASYVDGGIIGGPPAAPGDARLYLSGPRAGKIAGLFAGTPLDARVIGGEPGAASAVKMAYAAWTKGTAALLLAARALARAEGVEDTLLAEWGQSQPALAARSQGAAVSAAGKGWRWAGEMEEIAASMATVGLPPGFHQAAAEIFRRSPRTAATDGVLAEVIRALLAGGQQTRW